MVSRIADINFCPTSYSASNLHSEQTKGKIHVVGNTVLDNIKKDRSETSYGNTCLITLHRNENLNVLDLWLNEIERFASNHPEIEFIFPAHPNPIILKACENLKKIKVVKPLQHGDLIDILKKCKFVITDSGGIQEEGCFLNKKIIVCRKTTERPEGIPTGHIVMCEDPKNIYEKIEKVNDNFIIIECCPYGNGNASEKILNILNINV